MKILKGILFGLLALAILAGAMATSENVVTSEVIRDSIKEYNTARETGGHGFGVRTCGACERVVCTGA